MPAVRVRLVVGGLRLEFSGEEALFEHLVSPLVEAAYRRAAGLAPARGGSSPVSVGSPAHDEAPVGGSEPEAEAAPPQKAEDEGYVPQSSQFSSFLRKVGARAANPEQQLVAFAFYLWNYEDRQRFDAEALQGCFRAVGLPAPDPLDSRLADLCDRKRFFARVGGDDGQLELTSKGVNYVKTRLLTDI